ncbi:MAG: response regulator [Myxococcota bacterium]|nr:hypothetical protein [Deltaproteobacteria bacterium]MCP4244256.1 response regulator [bacterium]MDP6074603.1 response regulator [Myxococcota bacterium]MDP6244495.1 response regulator [Myxococcota bacterium]MDP7074273.1 response regulator [Myxococcota bacterium]
MEKTRTILFADGTAMFRELGSIFLDCTGRVVTANDGYESLEALRKYRPGIVVADLDMPRMGGDELCRHIRNDPETRKLPVILLTGSGLADDRARAMHAGADDVITKPISRIALVQAVNRFLSGRPQRGLPRASFESDVRILQSGEVYEGAARNLSRGGIFVESDPIVALANEVSLEFTLPDLEEPIAPTAQVIWRQPPGTRHPPGMGLQFLALDRTSTDRIDDFVYENSDFGDANAAARAAGVQ